MNAPLNIATRFAQVEARRSASRHEPWLSHPVAVVFVALTVLIMSYSSLFSVFPILIYFSLWLLPVLSKGLRTLRPTTDMLWAFAIPSLCLVSTLWSNHPATTLYLGTAFMVFMLCIVSMNRLVRYAALIEGLALGVAVTLVISIISQRYALDHISGTYSLIGYFGSKNMVGFTAQLGIIGALFVLFTRPGWWRKLLLGLAPLIISIAALYMSRSGTALLTLITTLSAITLVAVIARIPRQLRAFTLTISLLLLVAGTVYAVSMGGYETVLKSIGKDTTLTGRTDLWERGKTIGWEKPVLGHGYAAFWVQGEPRAEALWHEFYVTARGGFHFHNIYIQTFVDLGGVGVAVIALLVLAGVLATTRALIRYGAHAELLLLFAIAIMFLARSFVEVDFFMGPFGMGSLLFYSVLPRLAAIKREQRTADAHSRA